VTEGRKGLCKEHCGEGHSYGQREEGLAGTKQAEAAKDGPVRQLRAYSDEGRAGAVTQADAGTPGGIRLCVRRTKSLPKTLSKEHQRAVQLAETPQAHIQEEARLAHVVRAHMHTHTLLYLRRACLASSFCTYEVLVWLLGNLRPTCMRAYVHFLGWCDCFAPAQPVGHMHMVCLCA